MANGDEMVTVEQLKLFEDTKLSSSLKLVSGYAIGTYSGIPIQNLVMAKDPEDVGAGTVQMGIDGDHGNVQIIGLIGDSKVAIQATTENEVAIMVEAENVRAGIGVSNASPVMVFGSKQILSITDDASTGDTNALATAKAVKDYVDANGSSVDVATDEQANAFLNSNIGPFDIIEPEWASQGWKWEATRQASTVDAQTVHVDVTIDISGSNMNDDTVFFRVPPELAPSEAMTFDNAAKDSGSLPNSSGVRLDPDGNAYTTRDVYFSTPTVTFSYPNPHPPTATGNECVTLSQFKTHAGGGGRRERRWWRCRCLLRWR